MAVEEVPMSSNSFGAKNDLTAGGRTFEVFRLDGEGWRLALSVAGRTGVRAEPFDALELDLAALWAR